MVYRYLKSEIRIVMGFLCLLTVIIPFTVYAESHIGLMAGPSAATMRGDFIEGRNGSELGASFALTLDRELSDRWAFVTGIHMIQKGGKKLTLSSETGNTYGFQTMYLQVPLLARAAFALSDGPWYVAPFSGLAIGLNTSCKHKDGEQFEFEEEGCNEDSPGG